MRVGDIVKYHFPDPKSRDKENILGIITIVGESLIVIDCIDTTKLKVTTKNFSRVEIVKSRLNETSKALA